MEEINVNRLKPSDRERYWMICAILELAKRLTEHGINRVFISEGAEATLKELKNG